MASAPAAVTDLVARYLHNRDLYRRPDYNETQLRREFLDPFFEALGWDVSNRAGNAPQYREVVHEAALRQRGGGVIAPDYAFRVGTECKFYVEAKKPAVDIRSDPSPAYQLRRYAWTAGRPLSILSDFEEFAVYDCRFRPAPGDHAGQARVMFLTCDQYADRWEEIAGIFGRDAVWRGDFDRYAESSRAKRGTQEVGDAFLQEIEAWREALARNIALRNPDVAGVRDLNYAVGKIIDRIVFLRICEDRDIEPYGRLQEAATGSGVYPRLMALFRQADARYNSGLFHLAEERGRSEPLDTLTPRLTVDDRVLREIITSLYYPASPYEFSVLGADILGNVYERFLGSVIRLTPAHRAVVEQKPEVRKAGGVYYTPRYIVEYIVAHTLGPLLEGRTPGQVAALRIVDPACGSGSFLLGAYQYLLDWHLRWYTEHPTATPRRELYPGPNGEPRLTSAEKKRILLNNIYGVDIDAQAVEVTKLSLLLKVLEGETAASLQLALVPERALPDLGANVQCGNSLIGSDYFAGAQLSLLGGEAWERVNPLDWERAFPEVMAAGGFDAVIGNPPWGATFDGASDAYLRGHYCAAQSREVDSYALFFECAIARVRLGGRVGLITPDTFLRKDDRLPVRKLLLERTSIAELVETGPMFSAVRDTWCLVSVLEKGACQPAHRIVHRQISRFVVSAEERLSRFARAEWDREELVPQALWSSRPGAVFGYLCSEPEQALVAKMERWPRLGDPSCGLAVSRGEEGSKFALQPFESGEYRMVIPADVERYYVSSGMPVSGRSLTPAKVAGFYSHPKIWVIRIQKMRWRQRLVSAFDPRRTSAAMKTLQVVVSANDDEAQLKYVQAILASRLINLWCVNYLSDDMNKSYLAQLPIRAIDFADPADVARHDRLVALVERMLALHEELAAARASAPAHVVLLERQIAATDAEIDRLVYDLYGLTDEEIRLVEGEGP